MFEANFFLHRLEVLTQFQDWELGQSVSLKIAQNFCVWYFPKLQPSHYPLAQCKHPWNSPNGTVFSHCPSDFPTFAFRLKRIFLLSFNLLYLGLKPICQDKVSCTVRSNFINRTVLLLHQLQSLTSTTAPEERSLVSNTLPKSGFSLSNLQLCSVKF